MAWHTACHRVNRVFHGDALVGEFFCEFFQRMLCTGNCQAIARDNDHGFGIGQHKGCVIRRAAFYRALLAAASRHRPRFTTKAAKNHIEKRSIHGLTHDVRQNRTA